MQHNVVIRSSSALGRNQGKAQANVDRPRATKYEGRINAGRRVLRGIDPWLMLAFLGLACIGVLMVYSSSIADSYAYYGSAMYFFQREVVWVVVGLLAVAVVLRIDYHRLQSVALPVFGISLVMLVLVLAPQFGHAAGGARRWFSIGGGVTFEPSELMKLAAVIYMAAWLSSKGEGIRNIKRGLFPFGLIAGLMAILIIRQPDLGTAVVLTTTVIAVFFVSGANMLHMLIVGLASTGIGWFLAQSSSYRYGRLTAFLDPWKDPTGVGYHTIQALLALGSGGLLGVGLGNSAQKYVLPAPHTDSILAVIGEEWGLLGTLTVLGLFIVIAYRGIHIALRAPDTFGRLLAVGITSWISFQALLNFAVITSSVPFTGVPLPFISYGGSSLIITMTAMGILLNISRHAPGEGLAHENDHHGRGDRRTRIPRVGDHRTPEPAPKPARSAGSREPAKQQPRPLRRQPAAKRIDDSRPIKAAGLRRPAPR
jgi:cell division protein FtsW